MAAFFINILGEIAGKKSLEIFLCVLTLSSLLFSAYCQSYNVKGTIYTKSGPVKYASVTFVDKSDTSKKFTTYTDETGKFKLGVITGIDIYNSTFPKSFTLQQNYPNPFAKSTTISYKLNKQSEVSIKIYDILGKEVRTFSAKTQGSGVHNVIWDGRDNFGEKIAFGVYIYQLQTKESIMAKKMVFTGGSYSMPVTVRNNFKRISENFKKSHYAYSAGGIYTVQVRDLNNTQPQLSKKDFYNVSINSDTTFDFVVNKLTNYNKNIYAVNWGHNKIYVVDADLDEIIDTLSGFGDNINNAVITKSGAKLYVWTKQYSVYPYDTTYPAQVYSVDLQTTSIKKILEKQAFIYLEPDGTPLIFSYGLHDSLKQVGIIDTLTDEISFFDTLSVLDPQYERLVFNPATSIFYTYNNEYRLFSYDYNKKNIVRNYSVAADYDMTISRNGKYIYCANGPVLDIVNDNIVGSIPANRIGYLFLNPVNDFLYATDPASFNIEIPPSGRVNIFQASSPFSQTGYIDVNKASGLAYTSTEGMVIMPDGNKGYVSDSGANIFVVDLDSKEVVYTIKFEPRSIRLRFLILGNK